MEEFRIVPRTAAGLDPVVRDSKGNPRPALVGCLYYTAHYTGAGTWGDPGDTLSEIRAIEFNHARPTGKPNEYNYVIHQDEDNLIHEYAGEFMAAHSEGENSTAVGVLFLNGVNEPPNATQIRKWQWLRDRFLIPRGTLRTRPDQRRHSQMPGAATPCPGPHFDPVWPQMLKPYAELVTPPPIVPEEDTDMLALDWKPGTPAWTAFVTTGTHLSHVKDGHADQVLRNAGVKRVTVSDVQLLGFIRSTSKTSTPPATLTPEMLQAW